MKRIRFEKSKYPEFEFLDNRRVLPICVIFALKVKRLLFKRYEAYIAHVIDISVSEVNLGNVLEITFLTICRDYL